MADPPKPPAELPLAANGEVKAYDRLGNKVTVPKEKVGELYSMGGRVAPKAEVLAQQQHDDYEAQPTAKKVAGYASVVLPHAAQNLLSQQGIAPIPSGAEAFNSGVSSAATLGLDEVGVKAALDATAGPAAGKAYGKHLLEAREAHPGFHTAGQVVGTAAMTAMPTGGAASVLGGVTKLGSVVERGAAGALAGVAARGTIGRAIATGGELAVRGATEAALYSGAESINEQVLGDTNVVADKVWSAMGTGALFGAAGGAVLGGAGSLGASGARAGLGAARSGIAKVLSKGGELAETAAARAEGAAAEAGALGKTVASEVADDARTAVQREAAKATNVAVDTANEAAGEARKAARFAAEQTGTKVEQEIGSLRSKITEMGSKDAQKALANEQAWKAIGAGNGLQSTAFAKSAERYLPNGVKDVGEVMLRKKIINAEEGILNAARHGTPEAMLPRIEAEHAIVGKAIGDMTAASPAQVAGVEIGDAVSRVASKYEQSAATRAVGKSLRTFGEDLRLSLGINSLDKQVPIQDLLRERKAIDLMVFENAALDPSLTIQVKRELRSELEGLVVKGMDEAGGKLPGEVAAEYKALKHDYTALSIARDAAEDSAARMSKGATFGLTDTLRGGGSIVKTLGSKLVRERGNAAAAVMLSRMADMGTITRALKAVDEQIGRAATGALQLPRKSLPEATSRVPVRQRAEAAMQKWADVAANPERTAERSARAAEQYQTTAPMLAGGISQRITSAAAFMISKMPSAPDPDPFDPHPAPMLTDAQAAEYAAYDYYAERPMRFFEEAEHGKLTFEGVEVARALMPDAFAELQERTKIGLAELMAKKRPPPYLARQRLGSMLGFPAVPEQRDEHILFLQKNVVGSEKAATASSGGPSGGPKRPMSTKSQSSTLDRLEGK